MNTERNGYKFYSECEGCKRYYMKECYGCYWLEQYFVDDWFIKLKSHSKYKNTEYQKELAVERFEHSQKAGLVKIVYYESGFISKIKYWLKRWFT